MMRILFVTPCAGWHEAKFVQSLSEHGYTTRIFSFHRKEVHAHLRTLPNITLDYFPLRVAPRFQRFITYRFLPRLRKTIDEFKPDLIHAGNTWNDSYLAALTGFHPLLVMPYGSDVLLDTQRSRILGAFNRVTFRAADWVTCDAEHVKRKIIKDFAYPADKITVIPWGIDVKSIGAGKAESRERVRKELSWQDKFVVIMTRVHEPGYGIDDFLKAMKHVFSKNANVRVILVGAGPLHQQFRDYIRTNNMDPFFHCTGKTAYAQVLEYLRAADLYVSASYSDGTSVSLLEGMAAGLPAVLTDVPSNLEWVTPGKNGEIVPRGDTTALADRILELAGAPARAKTYGKQCLEIVTRRGDWRDNFKEIEKIYHTLAG